MHKTITKTITAVALLGLTACDGTLEEPSEVLVDDFVEKGTQESNPEDAESIAVVVATLQTKDGATLVFNNEAAPGEPAIIGVEILSDVETPQTDAVLAQDPTALELYAYASPEAQAPSELLVEHALVAESSSIHTEAPRTFRLPAGTSSGYYNCADSATWQNDFTSWAPTLDGQYIQTYESGLLTGYVGYSPRFYFDICRPPGPSIPQYYYTGVQRRPNAGSNWVTINSNYNAINYQQRRWRYYRNSWSCSSYQYRLLTSSGSNRYHRAARWADQWSCSFTL